MATASNCWSSLSEPIWDTKLRAVWIVFAGLALLTSEIPRNINILENRVFRTAGSYIAAIGAAILAVVIIHIIYRAKPRSSVRIDFSSPATLLLFSLAASMVMIGIFIKIEEYYGLALYILLSSALFVTILKFENSAGLQRHRVWLIRFLLSTSFAGIFGITITIVKNSLLPKCNV